MARQTPALNRLSGWSLRSAVELDRSGHRGLLADLFCTSSIKMHAVCGWMAVLDGVRTTGATDRVAEEEPNLAIHLRKSSARELVTFAFKRQPPSGYLRALLKARPEPFRLPSHYKRLFGLFADAPESFKTNALRFAPSINSTMIEAVDELNPHLVVPAVIASIDDSADLQLVNRVFEFVQQRCATSEAVGIFGRYGVSRGLDKALGRCLRKLSFPAPPLIPFGNMRAISTPKELEENAEAFSNCLKTKIADVVLGFSYFYAGSVLDGDKNEDVQVILELRRGYDEWLLEGVHGRGNKWLPGEVQRRASEIAARMGAIVRVNPISTRAEEDVARLLRLGTFGLDHLPTAARIAPADHSNPAEATEII